MAVLGVVSRCAHTIGVVKRLASVRPRSTNSWRFAINNPLAFKRLIIALVLLLSPLFSTIAQSTDSVGALRGSFEVSGSGQATYGIPITVPPGINGVVPRLSLSYSSGGGNGFTGVGGSLSGFSAITRCSSTLAQEGEVGGVNHDSSDRFCLGGQKLVAINGDYGANGTEYRTAIESFQKIISNGSINYPGGGSGPESFTVYNRTGGVTYYGVTANARIVHPTTGVVHRWWVSQLQDAKGNAIDYLYSDNSANNPDGVSSIERLPSQIHYGRNDSQTVAGDVDVKLIYETRPDPVYSYGNGMGFKLTQRLSNIQTYVADVLVRDYRIGYDQDPITNHSRMIIAQECVANNVCTPPTTFDWHDVEIGWSPLSNTPPDDLISATGAARGMLVDLNNDGWTDWITAVRNSDGSESKTAWLNGPSGWTLNGVYTPPDVLFDYTAGSNGATVGRLVDLNSDGKPDWVNAYTDAGGTTNAAWLNTGSGWTRTTNFDLPIILVDTSTNALGEGYASFIDLNGDALTDLTVSTRTPAGDTVNAWLNTGTGWQQNSNYAPPEIQADYSSNSNGIHRGRYTDINSDGLPDWLTAVKYADGSEDYATWLNTGSGWLQNNSYNVPGVFLSYAVNPKGNPISDLIDINGDGLADLVQAYQAGNNPQVKNTWLFTGAGWIQSSTLTPPRIGARFNSDNTIDGLGSFLDLNADGLVDFVESYQPVSGGAVNNVWRNTGQGWTQDNSLKLPEALTRHRSNQDSIPRGSLSEVNGDGSIDLIIAAAGSNGGSIIHASSGDGATPAAVHTITNGLGFTNKVEYATRLDEGVYVPSTDGVYPNIDNAGPMTLVSAAEATDGVGGWARSEHQYGGSKLNLLGRGSLGFAFHDVRDPRTGVELHNNYLQTYPFTGSVAGSNKTLDDGAIIHQSTSTYANKSLNDGATIFPYSDSKHTDTAKLNGDVVSSVTTTLVYDDYGNVTDTTSTSTIAGEIGEYTKTLHHTYTNDIPNWLLGLKTTSSATHSAPGQVSITRNTSTSYTDGMIVGQTIEPGNANAVTTSYLYDGFGHATQTTVSATGVTDRISKVTYSTDGKFPTEATNAINHTGSKEYDARFGVVTRAVDANGQITEWLYDDFGAELKKTDVRGEVDTDDNGDDGKEVTVLKWCTEPNSNCPANAVYFATAVDNQKESPESVYFDVFGRTIRKQTFGFAYNPDPQGEAPQAPTVYQDTEYDAFGKKYKVSIPYFETETPPSSTTLYDILGRPISKTAPNGAETTIAYQGRTTSVTNALSQTSSKTVNAQGKPVKSIDSMGNVTTYVYNALGHLTGTIDPKSNTISTTYDLFGRKTAMSDPDMGSWTYAYDALGNLVSQTDAKGQTVTIQYDLLNRKIRRVETEGETLWSYDTATKGKGKPASVAFTAAGSSTPSYSREYQYDDFGRLTQTTITQNGEVYVTESGYQGTTDRIDWVQYPSNLMVRKAYDAYGFPTEIRSDGLVTWQAYLSQAQVATDLNDDYLALYDELQPQIQAAVNQYNNYAAQARPFETEARRLSSNANHWAALYASVASKARYWGKQYNLHLAAYDRHLAEAQRLEALNAHAEKKQYIEWANIEADRAEAAWAQYEALQPQLAHNLANAEGYSRQANEKIQQANYYYGLGAPYANTANALNKQLQAAIDLVEEANKLAENLLDQYNNESVLQWQAREVAANGQVIKSIQGNGVITEHGIEAATGRILSIHTENDPDSPAASPYLSEQQVTRLLESIQETITDFSTEAITHTQEGQDATAQADAAWVKVQAAEAQATFYRQIDQIGQALVADADAAGLRAEHNLHQVNAQLYVGLAQIENDSVQTLTAIQAQHTNLELGAGGSRQLQADYEQALADHYRAIEQLYQGLSSEQTVVSSEYQVAAATPPEQTELDNLTVLAGYQTSMSTSFTRNGDILDGLAEITTATNSTAVTIESRTSANVANIYNSRSYSLQGLAGALDKIYKQVNDSNTQLAASYNTAGDPNSAGFFTQRAALGDARVDYFSNLADHYRTVAANALIEDVSSTESTTTRYLQISSMLNTASTFYTQQATTYTEMAAPTWWTDRYIDFDSEVIGLTTIYDDLAIKNAQLAEDHEAKVAEALDALAHAVLISTDGKIQALSYSYDSLGNLLTRTDDAVDLYETFDHDNLNRLTQSTLTGTGAATYVMVGLDTVNYSYDQLGNITSKSDVGAYVYGEGAAGPHAVTTVSGVINATYSYDANGNQTSTSATSNNRTVSWSSFDKPTEIVNDGTTTSMTYGPERQLIEMTVGDTGTAKTTVYVGSIYEKTTTGTTTEERHHITLNGKAIAVINKRSETDIETHYLHRDHLDSITAITDEHGYLVERFHYDAFGQRRKAVVEGDPLANTIDSVTDRGYTGHRQMTSAGLIHMGGRVYDAMLGRFLSADPNIQAPMFSQSFNRYSYVWNNPLSFVDPSGYFLGGLLKKLKGLFNKVVNLVKKVVRKVVTFVKKYWRQIAAVVIITVTAGSGAVMLGALGATTGGAFVAVGGALTAMGTVAVAAIGGGLAGLITTGSLKGALMGAVQGAAFAGVGNLKLAGMKNVFAHETVGGVTTKIQGGSFSKSFLSTGLSAFLAPQIGKLKGDGLGARAARIGTAGLIGGGTSKLAGGSFDRGFVNSAFSQGFNRELHLEGHGEGSLTNQLKRAKNSLLRLFGSEDKLVIGEDMSRVSAYADKNGADYYGGLGRKGTKMEYTIDNTAFIVEKMDQGYTIIDIGPAPNDSINYPNYPNISSYSYELELDHVRNYPVTGAVYKNYKVSRENFDRWFEDSFK